MSTVEIFLLSNVRLYKPKFVIAELSLHFSIYPIWNSASVIEPIYDISGLWCRYHLISAAYMLSVNHTRPNTCQIFLSFLLSSISIPNSLAFRASLSPPPFLSRDRLTDEDCICDARLDLRSMSNHADNDGLFTCMKNK